MLCRRKDITILATNVNNNKVYNKLESVLIKKEIPVHLFKTHGRWRKCNN